MITLSGSDLKKIDISSPLYQKLIGAAPKLAKKDATLWGESAKAEAMTRLNWIDLPKTSREILPQLDALYAWARESKLDQIVLSGMGGSSLAPEVIASHYKKELFVLDSTDPSHVMSSIDGDLSHTLLIVGSKSGSTIETTSHLAAFTAAFIKAKLDPAAHIVIVTDSGSPLDITARENRYRVINADPNVGGRFSALSAFGLTPAALLGIDVSVLLDEADEAAEKFAAPDSPAIAMAALLSLPEYQYTAFSDTHSNIPGIGSWIEQLIAESTGKDGKGLLPIVLQSPTSPIGGLHPLITFDGSGNLSVQGSLGAHFIFWEWVTALLCLAMDVDPFNQPSVSQSKEKTGALLLRWSDGKIRSPNPIFVNDAVEIYSEKKFSSLTDYLNYAILQSHGYIAIMAYLNRTDKKEAAAIDHLRNYIAGKSAKPTTSGWGPRFLHSTGQFHKGGPKVGSFIQITAEPSLDYLIPEKKYGFATLLMAQALGDGEALVARNSPLIRIHLKDRLSGIALIATISDEE